MRMSLRKRLCSKWSSSSGVQEQFRPLHRSRGNLQSPSWRCLHRTCYCVQLRKTGNTIRNSILRQKKKCRLSSRCCSTILKLHNSSKFDSNLQLSLHLEGPIRNQLITKLCSQHASFVACQEQSLKTVSVQCPSMTSLAGT